MHVRTFLPVLASLLVACGGSAHEDGPSPPAIAGSSGDWSCVGGATTHAAPTGPASIGLEEALTARPLSDLVVKACASDDAACATPIAETTTDASGVAATTTARGYLEVSGPSVLTNLVFASHGNAVVYSATALAVTQQADERSIDSPPSRAFVRIAVVDCAGNAAAGVVVRIREADDATAIAYSDGALGFPYRGARATDETGLAFAFDVPPGPITLEAILPDGRVVATSSRFGRAGAASIVELAP